MIKVYCDGSSSGRSDKPGGWAYVIVREEKGEEFVLACGYGGDPSTTNNIMELTAAIKGLEKFVEMGLEGPVDLVSDSQYTLGLACGSYTPSKNIELAQKLYELAKQTGMQSLWVRGHGGSLWNCRCDSLAKRGKYEISVGMDPEAEQMCDKLFASRPGRNIRRPLKKQESK